MPGLIPLFLILFAGLFFSKLLSRLHLPWVIALILGGILIGPHGLDLIRVDPIIEFLAQVGIVFLMFMAGLEVRLSALRELKKGIAKIALLNTVIPFLVGVGVGYYFGFPPSIIFLLGIIFISSSIAVVIPSLRSSGILHTKLGRSIVAATMIGDVLSLVLLSILLQTINPITTLPLPLFYLLLLVALVVLRWATPKIYNLFRNKSGGSDIFEQEVQAIVTVLVGTVVIFELLGLHGIIAGFFAGLVLSDILASEAIKEKLHTLGYGLFIPVFFVVVGANTDLSVFAISSGALLLTVVVIVASVFSKFISGWIGGRLSGFGPHSSRLVGVATIPQLSTTLAVVFVASELSLLTPSLVAALVALSIITTFLGPILIQAISKKRAIEN